MNKCLVALLLGCAVVLGGEAALAQRGPTPAERERSCALRAHSAGLTGARYSIYMRRCTRFSSTTGGPVAPPPGNPSSAPPLQPPVQPGSPRAISCNKQVLELGMTGAAAQSYMARCMAHSSAQPAATQNPSRAVTCNQMAQELGLTGAAAQSYMARCMAH